MMKIACESLIDDMSEKNHRENPLEEGDYLGEDGLWYCGNCRTPRQCRLNEFIQRTVWCSCECRKKAEREKNEEARRKRLAEDRLDKAFEHSAMRRYCFENDDGHNPALTEAAKEYCENFDQYRNEGLGLLFWGDDKGTGKSFTAACIVNSLCWNGWRAMMLTVSDILGKLSYRDDNSSFLSLLKQVDLLVLDDFDAHRRSEWANEKIFDVIDGRCSAGKPTVITTNLTIDQIKNPSGDLDERICDRILDMCHPIHVTGKSRRRVKAAANYAKNVGRFGL